MKRATAYVPVLLLSIFLCSNLSAASKEGAVFTGPKTSWDVLRHGLTEKNPDDRVKCLTAIRTLGPLPDAVQLVTSALRNDKDSTVRQAAAGALGKMKAASAIPDLKAALDDEPEVAFTAAKSLSDLGDRSGDDLIFQVIGGQSKNGPGFMTEAIRNAKRKMRSPGQLTLMGVKEATGAFIGPGGMGIDAITEMHKDHGAAGRSVAALLLADNPDPYALTVLEWALQDSNWVVRAAAAEALGVRGNAGSISKLQPLFDDARHLPRYAAAVAIIRISECGKGSGSCPESPLKQLTLLQPSDAQK